MSSTRRSLVTTHLWPPVLPAKDRPEGQLQICGKCGEKRYWSRPAKRWMYLRYGTLFKHISDCIVTKASGSR